MHRCRDWRRRCARLGVDDVADTVDCFDEWRAKGLVDFVPQGFDVDVDGVVPALFSGIPRVVEYHGAGDGAALVGDEVFQDVEFFAA